MPRHNTWANQHTVDRSRTDDKRCNRCKRTKPIRLFAKDASRGDGHQTYCKNCRNKTQNWWRQHHQARWALSQRRKWLKKLYGITPEQFDALWRKQRRRCAICRAKVTDKNKRAFDVDHNHKTGKVRGILCSRCNRGLGAFLDSPRLLNKAVQYLNAA